MKDFRGAHVLVTGGSSGIGLATAELLASRGAHVTLVARDQGRLETACEAVKARAKDASQHVSWVAADASDPEQAKRAVAEAGAAQGKPVDLLVNAAGAILPGYFESMPEAYFEECMDSWRACVHMTRAAVPQMIERRRGHIVNVSSMGGFMAIFGYSAYSSAKYAVMGLSEALRIEMRPYGIGVTVICPPDTDTPGLALEKSLRPAETDKVAGNLGAVTPDVVAKALVTGVERNRYMVVPGAVGKLYQALKAVAPWIFFAVVDGDVRAARKARGLA